jgi:hypothetical protein
VSPARRAIADISASHSRAADSTSNIEHRLQIERRSADHLEYIRCCGLLLQGLAQILGSLMKFFEQSNILDRNHRLVGECGDEIDLLLAERLHALAGENENADRLIFPQQWHAKRSALTGQRYRFAHRVFGIGSDVGDLHRVAPRGR